MASVDWGAGGKGALTGAGAGAAIGTAFLPGVGTALGAGIGGLGGFLLGGGISGASDALGYGNPYAGLSSYPMPAPYQVPGAVAPDASMYGVNATGINDSLARLQAFANAPGVSVDQSASQGTGVQQQSLIDLLTGSANGTAGPSAAQLQMGQGLDQALAQGRSVAQSLQASNPIAALQAAGGAQSLLQRQSLGDMATLRAQEQLNARQQLEQALSSKRYGDVTDSSQRLQADMGNRQMQQSTLAALLSGNTNLASMQQQGTEAYDAARMSGQTEYNRNLMSAQTNYSNLLAGNVMAARNEYVQSRAADLQSRRQMLSTIAATGSAAASAYLAGQRGTSAAGSDATSLSVASSNADIKGGLANPTGNNTGGGGYVDPYGNLSNPYN